MYVLININKYKVTCRVIYKQCNIMVRKWIYGYKDTFLNCVKDNYFIVYYIQLSNKTKFSRLYLHNYNRFFTLALSHSWHNNIYTYKNISRYEIAKCNNYKVWYKWYYYIFKPGAPGLRPARVWFLKIDPVRIVGMRACVHVRAQGY